MVAPLGRLTYPGQRVPFWQARRRALGAQPAGRWLCRLRADPGGIPLATPCQAGERLTPLDFDKMEAGFRQVLEGLGLAPDDPYFRDSPKRMARAWGEELCAGLREPELAFEVYPIEEGFQAGLIALQSIPVKSLCAHHFLPLAGHAVVGYLPDAHFCGLSSLSRVVDHFSRRPQLQENLTSQVAQFLARQLKARGVGVVVKASHYCMEFRGVNHEGLMTTSTLLGEFKENSDLRAEFLALANAPQRS